MLPSFCLAVTTSQKLTVEAALPCPRGSDVRQEVPRTPTPLPARQKGGPTNSYGTLLSQVSDDLGFVFALAHLPVLYFLVSGLCLDKYLSV